MKEWKGHLEKELKDDEKLDHVLEQNKEEDHRHVISSIIADGLGPLGKYTRGGQK